MHFEILTCDETPKIIEAYEFHIGNSADEGVACVRRGRSSTGPARESADEVLFKAESYARQIQALVSQSIGGISNLPERRTLSMRLEYRKGTPSDYEPPFFRRAEAADILKPKNKMAAPIKAEPLENKFHTLSFLLHREVDDDVNNLDFGQNMMSDDEEEESSLIPIKSLSKMNLKPSTNQPQWIASPSTPSISMRSANVGFDTNKEADELWERALCFVRSLEYVKVEDLVRNLELEHSVASSLLRKAEREGILGQSSKYIHT